MKVGIPYEILSIEWIEALKSEMGNLDPSISWHHAPSGKGPSPVFLEGDACLPFKKMVRTSLALLPDIDVLFLPRITGLDGFLMCPNFRALPDVVEINKEKLGAYPEVPVVSPLLDIPGEEKVHPLARDAVISLKGDSSLKKSGMKVSGNRKKTRPTKKDLSRAVALIGHPYVLGDAKLNSGVPEILDAAGLETVTAREVPFKELDMLAGSRDYYAKKMYWRPGREILGAFLYFSNVCRPAGIIQLIAFNCGVEALLRIELMSIYKKMDRPLPYMVLVCDEHTQRDHVVTRVEAFLDIIDGIRIK